LPQLKNEYGDAVFVFSSIDVISCKLCHSDSIFPEKRHVSDESVGSSKRQL